MSYLKKYKFGKNESSLLLGLVHNDKLSLDYVKMLLNEQNFEYFFVELNKENYNFIKKNKFFISEFYPIFTKSRNIELIDLNLQKEIKYLYGTNNTYENLLQYKLDRMIYFKLRQILYHNNLEEGLNYYNTKHFHLGHILYREAYMIQKIKSKLNPEIRNLILVGLSHFEPIKEVIINI
jgi:hypothetical protein